MADRVTPEEAHDWRKDRPGMGFGNALTIIAVFAAWGGVLAWLFAPTISDAIAALTAPPAACVAIDLTAAECGALMEDAR